ncbi:MAG: dienelactone hydrolase family protein [Rhodospirillaceae bacterium]|nr:dienelactone hydrolase family protein [Rhodospirillaceae bacterium]
MCDEHSMTDMAEAQLSRRRLGALTIGASLMAALPRAANAVDVKESNVTIKTPDGEAEAHFVHPAAGKAPAVLVWPDAFGLRPAFTQMGKRLAESGYAVLTINPYYRTAKVPALPAGLDFAKPDDRAQIMKLMSTLSPATHVTDAKAFIGWIDGQSAVDTGKKMGTTGYCMGGPITMRTAAERPDRVGGAASFHGGGLVTDQPNSPHLLVSKIKAQYLFAVAQNDDQQQPTAKDVLRDEFAKAKLKAEIEVYPAAHGWCPPDAAVYDQAQAEKAWSRMLAIFKTALV